jgi:hypothetical protein
MSTIESTEPAAEAPPLASPPKPGWGYGVLGVMLGAALGIAAIIVGWGFGRFLP